jgi:phenylpropionate dioxygenase-like ring-hydroxylating dioxygenase large terminal subunit
VPNLREAYHGDLDRERLGLIPVAQLESYKGLWFATFDPEAPPLREYLGEMAWYIDTFVDRREGGIEVVATHKWIMPCNWKFPAENFGGDFYHVGWSHLSAIETAFSSGASTKPDTTGSTVSPGNGHAVICFGANDVADPPVPEILEYEQQIRSEAESRLGPRSGLVTQLSARCSRISRCCASRRAHSGSGIHGGPKRQRSGRGFVPTKQRRHMSRRRSDWPASGASARPAHSSRTIWTIGRSARALVAARFRGGLC